MRIRVTAVVASLLVVVFAARVQGQAAKPAAPDNAKPTQHARPAHAAHVMAAASEIKWGPGPAAFPAGVELAVLKGDPSKAGLPFVVQCRMPDGYTIPPHWHPTDENVTILSGTLQMEMGKAFNPEALKDLGAGSYALMPARQPHAARAKGETMIQVHGVGPFAITYVNPQDDPRNAKKMTSSTARR